jgi:hypothetical protein
MQKYERYGNRTRVTCLEGKYVNHYTNRPVGYELIQTLGYDKVYGRALLWKYSCQRSIKLSVFALIRCKAADKVWMRIICWVTDLL